MTELNETVTNVGQASESARSLSILQEANKHRDTLTKNLFLSIPTWDGLLIGEYQVIDIDQLKAIAERAMSRSRANNDGSGAVKGDIDTIIATSVGFWVIDPDNGDKVMLEDEYGHVGYDRIAIVLGKEKEVKSNADVVKYLMAERSKDGSWKPNVIAMSTHANAIARWMRDTSRQGNLIEEVLGEL